MKKILLGLAALLLLAAPSIAQEQMGRIEGRVITEDSRAIAGAKVVISSPNLVSGTLETVCDGKGRFRFPILPIGTYSIKVTADQYQTFEQSGIVLNIGATVVINPKLKIGAFEEVITVTGEAPIIDPKSTDIGENISSDIINKLPVPRFPTEIISLTAGNVGSDFGTTLGGGAYSSNAYKLDGIDVSDPETGTTWVFINVESVEEIEIVPIAGTTADTGGFTGAAINMVTKSGGTEFTGGFAYYFFNDDFITWNTDDADIREKSSRYARNNDFTGFFGGPVFKKSLWFFGNIGWREEGNLQGVETPQLITQEYRNSIWKVSSMLRDDMNLWGMYHYDNYLVDGRFANYYRATEATADQNGPNHSFALHYAWVMDDNNLFEAKFHGWKGFFGYVGKGSGPYIEEQVELYGYGNSPQDYQAWRQHYDINGIYTRYVNDWIGDHEFKVGAHYQYGKGEYLFRYDWIYTQNGVNDIRFGYYPDDYGHQRTKGMVAYLMDGWTVNDRLLVNLGIRLERPTYSIPDGTRRDSGEAYSGLGDIHTFTNVAPRIGFTYKLTVDGRTILRGSYGRYYETMTTGLLQELSPIASPYLEFYWDGADWVEYYRDESDYTLDPDLKGMYVEAFTLGLEREMFRNIAFGIDYLHRQNKDFIVKREYNLQYEPYTYTDDTGTYSLFNWTNSDANPAYIIENADNDELFSKYDALILRAAKRYSDNWQLQASLTFSKFYGTAGIVSSSILATYYQVNGNLDYYSDPNNQINAEGLLPGHRPYNLKVSGTYTFPYEISVSGFAYYIAGARWTPILLYIDQELGQYYGFILAEERGIRTLDPIFNLDVRLEKMFQVRGYDFSLLADFYNVFNTGTVDGVEIRKDQDSFGEPTSLMDPRVIQLGVRFRF